MPASRYLKKVANIAAFFLFLDFNNQIIMQPTMLTSFTANHLTNNKLAHRLIL